MKATLAQEEKPTARFALDCPDEERHGIAQAGETGPRPPNVRLNHRRPRPRGDKGGSERHLRPPPTDCVYSVYQPTAISANSVDGTLPALGGPLLVSRGGSILVSASAVDDGVAVYRLRRKTLARGNELKTSVYSLVS